VWHALAVGNTPAHNELKLRVSRNTAIVPSDINN
jgi:hypothetical protein